MDSIVIDLQTTIFITRVMATKSTITSDLMYRVGIRDIIKDKITKSRIREPIDDSTTRIETHLS
ncbi:unnamed protein product [Dovyalis caffra]|uniref:Uncharacterized protein n=1 Tax=Dovyalis caffra TaxID=77055 RepID=A0AAV1RF69_9ROSI|nr:unnamed protein product [Dovyalis caffra]